MFCERLFTSEIVEKSVVGAAIDSLSLDVLFGGPSGAPGVPIEPWGPHQQASPRIFRIRIKL